MKKRAESYSIEFFIKWIIAIIMLILLLSGIYYIFDKFIFAGV